MSNVKGRYYKRTGNANYQMTLTEVADMHLQTINTSWDAYPDPTHTIEEISLEKVAASMEGMKQNHLSITEDPLSFLLKHGLILTVEDLLSNTYKSTPRNKKLADFFKDLGLIEKYGSGIRRIIDSFVSENLPKPDFRNISDGFMVTVYAEKAPATTAETIPESKEKIISRIMEDPTISTKELSEILGLSMSGIEKNIRELKRSGHLQRIGPAKGGYWQITGK